jgi:hypothetical protein
MRTAIAGAAAALGLLIVAAPAAAISDEQACFESGGISYHKEGGTSFCEYPVGNSDNVKTTTQKGSYESSHGEGKINPGGNEPPGQQGGDTLR